MKLVVRTEVDLAQTAITPKDLGFSNDEWNRLSGKQKQELVVDYVHDRLVTISFSEAE